MFGKRMKNFGRKLGKVDPVMGRLLNGDSKDREKFKPQQQFVGGDKEAYERYQQNYGAGVANANDTTKAGVERSNQAADAGSAALQRNALVANNFVDNQRGASEVAGQGFNQSMGDYRSGRDLILRNAGTMEADAANLDKNYMQTSDKAFRANQDANQRAALSVAAGRGASGLRTALASSTNANAQAANQAEITRAQEFNQLQGMKQNALVNASNVRSGVANQDQAAGSIYSTRQQTADANQLAGNAQSGNLTTAAAGLQQQAGALQTQAGTAQRGQYLGATANLEGTQMAGNQTYEQQRQGNERETYNRKWFPIMSSFNQA